MQTISVTKHPERFEELFSHLFYNRWSDCGEKVEEYWVELNAEIIVDDEGTPVIRFWIPDEQDNFEDAMELYESLFPDEYTVSRVGGLHIDCWWD